MKRFILQPIYPGQGPLKWPYKPKEEDEKYSKGDEEMKRKVLLRKAWLAETSSEVGRCQALER
jgi:hypothetical protein